MTLRKRVSCCCFSFVSILPVTAVLCSAIQLPAPPMAQSQSPAAAIELTEIHPPDRPGGIELLSAETQGDLLAIHQRYLDAIAAYKSAPQDSAVVANKIGVAYHHMFDIVDAKRNYERAIRMNPGYAEAFNNLGAIYHAEKNYKQAQRCYRKAIKLNPKSPLFYSNLGTSYFFQGNAKKGAEAYRQAFSLDPEVFEHTGGSKIEEFSSTKDLSTVNYALAKTYAHAGMTERALVYLSKAVREGYSDRRKLMNDPEFASLRETPEFLHILAMQQGR